MLTPEYLAECPDYILGLYDELDRAIIADISRRIVKTGGITATAKHQIDKVQQSGMLLDDVIKQVATVSEMSEVEVQDLFTEAAITSMEYDANPFIKAGVQREIHMSRQMEQLLHANIAKTNYNLKNLTMTTGMSASNKYLEAVNMAFMQTQSGAFSYSTAIRNAVKSAITDGNFVMFPSGHRDQLDVAVRRSVLTGLNQTTAKLTEMYSAEMDAEYYEVSAHAGARPSHEQWQGQVYKIHGSDRDYPNFADNTGYGTGDGLCGWGCRHGFHPFLPGISERAYTPEMLDEYKRAKYEYDGEKLTEYEVSQMMRTKERAIRATKREITGYQAAMDATTDPKLKAELKTDFEAASVKLKQQQKQYKDICNATNHRPDSVRTRVVAQKDESGRILSFDRSASQRTTQAYKRVEKTANKMYNMGSTEKNVKRYIADEKTKSRLRSDSTPKTVLRGKQDKHIKGTNNYKNGRSYLTVNESEIQGLVDQYAGTGEIKRSKTGQFSRREVCTADRVIGNVVDQDTGAEYPTHKFTIHYSNDGVHIVPAQED